MEKIVGTRLKFLGCVWICRDDPLPPLAGAVPVNGDGGGRGGTGGSPLRTGILIKTIIDRPVGTIQIVTGPAGTREERTH
jgi:hypothetical protein